MKKPGDRVHRVSGGACLRPMAWRRSESMACYSGRERVHRVERVAAVGALRMDVQKPSSFSTPFILNAPNEL